METLNTPHPGCKKVHAWLCLFVLPLFFWGCPSTVKKVVKTKPEFTAPVKKTAEENYQEALTLHRQGKRTGKVDYKTVIGLYRKALEEKPSLLQARFNLAAIYEAKGDYTSASGTLADVLRSKPDHAASVYRLAQVYYRMKQYRSSLSLMRRYLKMKPSLKKKPPMLLNLASIMVAAGDYPNALVQARKVLALNKKSVAAYRLIARVYLKKRRYDGVHLVYQLTGKLKKDAKLENIRGLAFMGQRKYPQALLAFNQATRIDPKLFAAQMNLGALALQYQDNQRAAQALAAAVKLRPDHRQAWLAYAVALRANKRFKQAESIYRNRLLKAKKNDTDALFNLGVLYVKFMSKPKDGKTYLRKYVGEKGDRISNTHTAYKLLKQAEQAIRMKEQMKKQAEADKRRAKERARRKRQAPPRRTAPRAAPPTPRAPKPQPRK